MCKDMPHSTFFLTSEFLDRITMLSRQAGQLIMDYYNNPERCIIQSKKDVSPVTNADQEAEQLIIQSLSAMTPHFPIISEEAAERNELPALKPEHRFFWLVDPLDGTRDFIQRSGEFTVNIALVDGEEVVLGVIYAPLQQTVYAAIKPANIVYTQSTGTQKTSITTRQTPRMQAKILNSRRQHPLSVMPMLPLDLTFIEHEFVSSSLKFCLIAEGRADFYPRRTAIMEWDTAAGQAILETAGGHVRLLDGAPLRYRKNGFSNPAFVAYGNFI